MNTFPDPRELISYGMISRQQEKDSWYWAKNCFRITMLGLRTLHGPPPLVPIHSSHPWPSAAPLLPSICSMPPCNIHLGTTCSLNLVYSLFLPNQYFFWLVLINQSLRALCSLIMNLSLRC